MVGVGTPDPVKMLILRTARAASVVAYARCVGNSFGTLFRITTFGESHGPGLGVVVDGCPARLPLDADAIQRELDRRRPGQSRLVTQRKEGDRVEILSGVLDGVTLDPECRAVAKQMLADLVTEIERLKERKYVS